MERSRDESTTSPTHHFGLTTVVRTVDVGFAVKFRSDTSSHVCPDVILITSQQMMGDAIVIRRAFAAVAWIDRRRKRGQKGC